MDYLIDSDVFIDYLESEAEATRWIESLIPAGVSISIVTYMESFQGTFRGPDPVANQELHVRFVKGIPVLPFTRESAQRCAKLRHDLRKEGKRVRSRVLDLMIAATAIEHGLTLVTRNRADYQDIPNLKLAAKPPR